MEGGEASLNPPGELAAHPSATGDTFPPCRLPVDEKQ
jgi:hypothetical protein